MMFNRDGWPFWFYAYTFGDYGMRRGLFGGFCLLPTRALTPLAEEIWSGMAVDVELSWPISRRATGRGLRWRFRVRSDADRIATARLAGGSKA